MNIHSNRPRVYKIKPLFWCRRCEPAPTIEKPWVAVTGFGHEQFDTWREAYDYARSFRVVMMNLSAA